MKSYIIGLAALILCCISCNKTPEASTDSSKAIPSGTSVEAITAVTAKASSTITLGFAITEIEDYGFCWGVAANPDLTGSHKSFGANSGQGPFSFSDTIKGLSANTHYFIRSYVKNQGLVLFGSQTEFNTLDLLLPQVSTGNVTYITAISAICGGNVTSDGNGTVSARGVCWNTTGNPTLANALGHTTDGSGPGQFSSSITGLSNLTTYYVTAYATNEKGTVYSTDVKQFIADFICGNAVPHGGKNYQTVQIGTQCWFKENLNIGTKINSSQEQTDNGIIEKYCYNDDESNCTTYGGLYQWDEMMQYVTTKGAKGICPDGWHLPTDAEWTMLTTKLGGESVAGGKMKEIGTVHWFSPNTGATNSSGFTALPGGSRGSIGSFTNLASSANSWSSLQLDTASSWSRSLTYDYEGVNRSYDTKEYGFSARCTKD